jgi:HEAT repeat protein
MTLLTSSDEQAALAEAERLGEPDVAGTERLIELLSHRSWTVRRAAVAALSRGSTESLARSVAALIEQRSSEPVVAGLVDALSAASPEADPLIRALLLDPRPPVLCDAIQIIGRRRDRESAPRVTALTDHEDDNVALSALEALGRIGGTEAVERLIGLAQGGNFFRAFPAIEMLGRSRDPRALPALRNLLQQPLYAPEAARALGRLGSPLAVPALVKAIEAGSESLLRIGARSLIALDESGEHGSESAVGRAVREHAGPMLRARVTRALTDADEQETIALGRLLVWLASEDSISDFVRLLGGREEVSVLALAGLRKLSALADPRVLDCLVQGDSELRARLLPAMMGVTAAAGAIIVCLDDEQAAVRTLACHALARSREREAVPRLFELLADPDLGVVHAAVGAIQSLGSEQTEALALAAVRSPKLGVRRAALRIITYFGYDATFELCLEALESDDERLRDIAVTGLPALEDPRVPGVLIQAARNPSARTRAAAVRALGHVSATSETEALLIASLDDVDAWVRYYACQSLGRRGIGNAVAAIAAKLRDPAGQVQMAAIEALAAIPGEDAADELARLTQSDDLEVKRAAVVGVGERRDPRLRPVLDSALASTDPAIRLVAVSSVARFDGAEAELGKAASSDADPSVQGAAVELLAQRSNDEATRILLDLLERDPTEKKLQAALSRELDRRIPALLARLQSADDRLSRVLVGRLSHSDSRAARTALDDAFASHNAPARRAAARALSALLDDAARSALARAATTDSDAEVRRICAAVLA